MSLLVFNSGSKIAQGLIRALHSTERYERIICADVYPNYNVIQSFIEFQATLPKNKTQVTDHKFTDKQDVSDLAKQANNLLYVSHDYYRLVPHKVDLLKNILTIQAFSGYQKLLWVAPADLDHADEQNTNQQIWNVHNGVSQTHKKLIGLRTNYTFGPDSVIANRLLTAIVQQKSLYFNPTNTTISPIGTQDVAQIVNNLLADQQHDGKVFLANGKKEILWAKYIQILEKALGSGYNASLNQSLVEKVFAPTSRNLVTETLYCPEYRNLVKSIANHQVPFETLGKVENAQSLLPNTTDIQEYYEKNPVQSQEFQKTKDLIERLFSY